jgi:N-acyl-D-amino-acid deacylase
VKVGEIENVDGTEEILDAEGMAVAPGFINMLSWGAEKLITDGRSMSGIKQGVTLELFGEGWSMVPLNETMKVNRWGEDPDDHLWTTLGESLEWLEDRGCLHQYRFLCRRHHVKNS